MTERMQVYRCEVCGNIVSILHPGAGELVCCQQPMKLLEENRTDAATEKHVPVISRESQGVRVKVGDVPHPMEPQHFIEWIELTAGGTTYRRFLEPGAAPEALFPPLEGELHAREYCNLHGLWRADA